MVGNSHGIQIVFTELSCCIALSISAISINLGSIIPQPKTFGQEQIVTVDAHVNRVGFEHWIAGFRNRALSAGITASLFDRAFSDVAYNEGVVEKDRNQTEFTKQIWDYLDIAVSADRVKNGKAALKKNHALLKQIEDTYGVDMKVVVAIWGLESAYGKIRGSTPVIEALATLAYDTRRGKFFESQLLAALKILQNGDVSVDNMLGSWAGAMGHTQFIPTSYLSYAQDFRGDGKRDIWSNDPTDALASTAAYLAKHGWTKGQPWGMEVILPSGFDYSQTGEPVRKRVASWTEMGVRDIKGKKVPDYGVASILVPAGADGAAFMIFNNFRVLETYNTADAYVIGVGHLADRIAGGPEIKADWPRGDRLITHKEKQEMQRLLIAKGFDPGGVDGIMGPKTIGAIRNFQRSIGQTPDGYGSSRILERLRS
jgi:membrane-bound lytic murein transglycosylase B